MAEIVKGLSAVELSTLAQHEAVIKRGLKTFADVGNALLAIRDARLYREQFDTFENYCRERWGMSRSRAHRMIDAARVCDVLPIGNKPATESQARPLARLPPAEQPEAWKQATENAEAEGRKVTARDVEEVVKERSVRDPLDVVQEQTPKEDKDSTVLFHLKRYWKQATKHDRKLFRRFIDEDQN